MCDDSQHQIPESLRTVFALLRSYIGVSFVLNATSTPSNGTFMALLAWIFIYELRALRFRKDIKELQEDLYEDEEETEA